MSDVAEYQVFVCALFPVQGGMWTDYFSAYNFRLIYDIQLVHLLVCNTQWIFKMHSATIKIIIVQYLH